MLLINSHLFDSRFSNDRKHLRDSLLLENIIFFQQTFVQPIGMATSWHRIGYLFLKALNIRYSVGVQQMHK